MCTNLILTFFIFFYIFFEVASHFNDICGLSNGKRFYLEHGESGSLIADYHYNAFETQQRNLSSYKKCTVEFITCPSCIIDIEFRFLNISRNCGKASVFDTCGCDYVWIYEPPIEDASGEQFCGRFLKNNISELTYVSQTRTVAVSFVYNNEYGHAFSLDYVSRRNKITVNGHPKPGNMNNATQHITSPFFPHPYPMDLSVEYVINCESSDICRISLLFTDFLMDESSIIEFFDWNGQRMYVISGNIFRPPVIISNGPSLVIRFYANGASDLGFKATYSFILGTLDETAFKPDIGCGGQVNNLGGGITMMNMVEEGTKLFDCVWILKPPENFLHRKTHLYVKTATFKDFAGTTELVIRQGVTSTQPSVEIQRHPNVHFSLSKQEEHVVPISQGFYIRFRGVFTPSSRLAIVYAAFNYKDCYGGSDFLCHNLRCISILLNCDGFDHCGDDSDEPSNCAQDPKDHREFSKIPNFLFPKMEPYSDITTATFVFLTCSFGLIGIILAMALLLYRVNTRARHQRQIQDHIETIHAILEEGVRDVEEEIITPDEPPDYEPPPEYTEVMKSKCAKYFGDIKLECTRCTQCNLATVNNTIQEIRSSPDLGEETSPAVAGTSRSCQTTPRKIPKSPPPAYENINPFRLAGRAVTPSELVSTSIRISEPMASTSFQATAFSIEQVLTHNQEEGFLSMPDFGQTSGYSKNRLIDELKKGFKSCTSANFLMRRKMRRSWSEENLVRYFSDSELILSSYDCVNYWDKVERKSYSTHDL